MVVSSTTMQKEPYNNTYCHTVNVVIHRNSLHTQDTDNYTPESMSYFPHRNSLHTDGHRHRQHRRHRGLNLSSILKYSFLSPTHRAIFTDSFRIPHMPPAGSLKVLHAPARQGEIRRASQTKIYNLETGEYVRNLPFLKTNLAGVIKYPSFRRE